MVGLIGLASFTAKRRTKEIGIRKVLGASVSGLYILITKEFLFILGISLAVACPAAYIVLITAPGYYKYTITPADYIVPVILVILFTLVTTMWQVLSITLTNPSKSLRTE
jgi:ABC-type antimicrobial peptide transport system permease subunit